MTDQTAPVPTTDDVRRVLVLAHTGREEAREVARACVRCPHRARHRRPAAGRGGGGPGPAAGTLEPALETVDAAQYAGVGCELALVIGGDGSILRAAEMTHASGTPLLGVNLGHVGFLAEAEQDDVESTIDAIVARRYVTEERLTLDVSVYRDKELVAETFALNEASVEKAARERMLEVVVEIDGRPLSRWGCDGVVCATPTGSTAYNFSAGGPVVWPGVEALLMVPISAHALFARPMVVSPTSVLAVEVLGNAEGAGVLWCDGRRPVDLPPGPASRSVAARGRSGSSACTRRRSRTDWSPSSTFLSRGGAARPSDAAARSPRSRRAASMFEEIRISSLGVIESSTLELGPGLTVITGETGAGKTMVVTALGLLLGGRADTGAVRSGSPHARVEGVVDARSLTAFCAAVDEVGGDTEGGQVVIARNIAAEGRSRAWVGGASVPCLADGRRDRVAGGGPRPVRPAPPAPGGRPARRARPVRRR